MVTKVSNKKISTSFPLKVIKGLFGYACLYHLLLAHPTVFKYYLRFFKSSAPTIPKDAPTQITLAKEVFTVHSFEDALPHMGAEPLIFRNFGNCAERFEKVLYPRHKDHVDSVEIIQHHETPGNVYFGGFSRVRKIMPKTLMEILDEKSTEYFPAFLQLFDDKDYQVLLNAKNDTRFKVESSFISHFNRSMVTTISHGDQRSQSLAIQCYGTRSFMFHSLADLQKYGFMPVPILNGAILRGTPDTINKIPTIRALINPGDVLYFPPMYYHAVAATKGKNVLFSVRKADAQSIMLSLKTAPSFLLTAALRIVYRNLFHPPSKNGFHITGEYMPFFDEFFSEVQTERASNGFKEYDGLADFGLPY